MALCFRSLTALLQALIDLDGTAEALLLVPGDADPAEVGRLQRAASCPALLTDRDDLRPMADAPRRGPVPDGTVWLVPTSGTTGRPTVVGHSLASLTRTVLVGDRAPRAARWGLTYDPTRFAGLQVLLQAILGDGAILDARGSDRVAVVDQLMAYGCDHLSATPSVWRRLLMHPRIAALPLRQVTLGGEAADDPVLRALAATFPAARISHIYASTEAGVGFTVTDGRAGFPVAYLETGRVRGVRLRLADGLLWVAPEGPRAVQTGPTADADGFLCTGDRVEVRGDRVHFVGRQGSGVNVGGTVVHLERVEGVLRTHPLVVQARVSARSNPVTGALLEADVVVAGEGSEELRRELVAYCRARLPREAAPRRIRVVADLELSAAGKLSR